MSEYASVPSNTANPLLNPRVYWQVSAYALAAASALGFVLNLALGNNVGLGDFLVFDHLHNTLHAVLAGAAFFFGYAKLPGHIVKTFAIVFGAVYGGLGVLGLIVGDFTLIPGLHVDLGETLIHTALGAWAITTGIAAKY